MTMNRDNLLLCLLGITLCFSLSEVSAKLKGEGIVGGEYASEGQFKYQVSLQVYGGNICGAGILDDHHILTAAHCVIDEHNKFHKLPMTVVAATNDLNFNESTSVRSEVVKVYTLKQYDGETVMTHGDIAVLKLSQPLGLGSNSRLASLELPTNVKETYVGKTAQIAGFGVNWVRVYEDSITGEKTEIGAFSNDKLRFAEVDVLENDDCDGIDDSQICARVVQRDPETPEGVCTGDSGGPLVIGGKTVIGVVSMSPTGCTEENEPAIYTRVSSYLDFIRNALKGVKTREMRVYVPKRTKLSTLLRQ